MTSKDPRRGDFQLVHTGGQGGFWIRIGQWLNGDGFRDYEHARLYLGDGQFVEAQPGGAVIREHPLNEGLWSSDIIELTDYQRDRICAAGRSYEGVGYSAMDYFAIAAYRLKFGLLIPGLRTYVKSSGHMQCAQLVDRAYQFGEEQLFNDGRWCGYVTPGGLASLLAKKLLAKLYIKKK